jgi:phosphocarrier protein HPr
MTECHATIVNPLGLHARPAAQFVKLATTFDAHVEVMKDGMPINGKSIMGVMMLAAECGSTLIVRADGTDEAAAVAALCELIDRGFGEL